MWAGACILHVFCLWFHRCFLASICVCMSTSTRSPVRGLMFLSCIKNHSSLCNLLSVLVQLWPKSFFLNFFYCIYLFIFSCHQLKAASFKISMIIDSILPEQLFQKQFCWPLQANYFEVAVLFEKSKWKLHFFWSSTDLTAEFKLGVVLAYTHWPGLIYASVIPYQRDNTPVSQNTPLHLASHNHKVVSQNTQEK